MKTYELNMNEMEQVNGGNILSDLVKAQRDIFQRPVKPTIPSIPTPPVPVIGRGKC
ncbi:MAG: hypothetical protein IKH57_11640 [Clostridia bacterium]|nr:hypothetical protein [Clostridia bacterium]